MWFVLIASEMSLWDLIKAVFMTHKIDANEKVYKFLREYFLLFETAKYVTSFQGLSTFSW